MTKAFEIVNSIRNGEAVYTSSVDDFEQKIFDELTQEEKLN